MLIFVILDRERQSLSLAQPDTFIGPYDYLEHASEAK